MKKLTVAITLFLMGSSICYAQQADPSNLTSDGKQVWNRVLELNSHVFGSKDSNAIRPFVHSSLYYGHSTGKMENARDMVHNAAVNATTYQQVSHQLVSMKMLKNAAVVRYVLKAVSVEKNVPVPLELGVIQVWQKEGGKWLLSERQAVKLIAPKN